MWRSVFSVGAHTAIKKPTEARGARAAGKHGPIRLALTQRGSQAGWPLFVGSLENLKRYLGAEAFFFNGFRRLGWPPIGQPKSGRKPFSWLPFGCQPWKRA